MSIYSIADMTTFMLFAIMLVELVEGVEGLITEFAFGMTCESGEGDVFDGLAGCKVRTKFPGSVENMFVSKYLFVLGA